MSDDCRHCGQPLGTHHEGAWDERLCAVKACDRYGYALPMPRSPEPCT